MKALDWIIIVIVAALLVLALVAYNKKGSCSCGSSNCSGNCAGCQYKCKKREND